MWCTYEWTVDISIQLKLYLPMSD